MPTKRYTAEELNQLLNETRLPTMAEHPCVGLLVSMALVLENIYALSGPNDPTDWMTRVAPVLQRELLAGLAVVLEHGVEVHRAAELVQ
jgi:hypothetical protein